MVNAGAFRAIDDAVARASWDRWLGEFDDASIRQSYAWAEHKRGLWTPRRWGWFDGETPLALVSGLERVAPLGVARLIWCNAGPVFQRRGRCGALESLASLLEGIKASAPARCVLRLGPRAPLDAGAERVLLRAGFAPASPRLDSGLTAIVDLAPPLKDLRARLDRKWRNQLKKAERFSPRIDFGADSALLRRLHALHERTCARKGLWADLIPLSRIEKTARDFKGSFVAAVASSGGVDGAAVCWWTFAGRSTLWLSASGERGMELCLPNALFWAMFERAKQDGARLFDLSGIDPERNPGVTHFKLGAGGMEVKTLGEWEWSNSSLAGTTVGAALRLFRRRIAR